MKKSQNKWQTKLAPLQEKCRNSGKDSLKAYWESLALHSEPSISDLQTQLDQANKNVKLFHSSNIGAEDNVRILKRDLDIPFDTDLRKYYSEQTSVVEENVRAQQALLQALQDEQKKLETVRTDSPEAWSGILRRSLEERQQSGGEEIKTQLAQLEKLSEGDKLVEEIQGCKRVIEAQNGDDSFAAQQLRSAAETRIKELEAELATLQVDGKSYLTQRALIWDKYEQLLDMKPEK